LVQAANCLDEFARISAERANNGTNHAYFVRAIINSKCPAGRNNSNRAS
jgi:hypothetical protein